MNKRNFLSSIVGVPMLIGCTSYADDESFNINCSRQPMKLFWLFSSEELDRYFGQISDGLQDVANGITNIGTPYTNTDQFSYKNIMDFQKYVLPLKSKFVFSKVKTLRSSIKIDGINPRLFEETSKDSNVISYTLKDNFIKSKIINQIKSEIYDKSYNKIQDVVIFDVMVYGKYHAIDSDVGLLWAYASLSDLKICSGENKV